jgi:hypothetical protein
MQLRDNSSFFEPDDFRALTAAYGATWQHLSAERSVPFEQMPALKKNLAQIILASACSGKRDVEQLKEIALRGVSAKPPIQNDLAGFTPVSPQARGC